MARRRRRRNPGALEWLTARSLLGVAVAAGAAAFVASKRAACDDGLPPNVLGCDDVTGLSVLVAAPIAIGFASQGGALEPGSFRTGIAGAGVLWGAVALLDMATGRARIAELVKRLADDREDSPGHDVVVTGAQGSAIVPRGAIATT